MVVNIQSFSHRCTPYKIEFNQLKNSGQVCPFGSLDNGQSIFLPTYLLTYKANTKQKSEKKSQGGCDGTNIKCCANVFVQRGKPTCRPGRVNLTSPCLHLYQTFLLLIALNGIFIIQRRLFFAVSSGPFYARFKLGNISSSINSSLVQGQSVGTLSGRSRDRN